MHPLKHLTATAVVGLATSFSKELFYCVGTSTKYNEALTVFVVLVEFQ